MASRRSTRRQEALRAEILEAARGSFERLGFEATTMRDIAREADVAVGTLFNYFQSKHALLFEALFEDLEQVKRQCLEELPPQGADVVALFEHVAMTFLAYYARRPALSRALLKESLLATGEVQARFQGQVEEVARALILRLEIMRQRQELDPACSPEHAVLAFISHYYFILLMGLRAPEPALGRQRALIRALAQQLVAGIGPRQPGSSSKQELWS